MHDREVSLYKVQNIFFHSYRLFILSEWLNNLKNAFLLYLLHWFRRSTLCSHTVHSPHATHIFVSISISTTPTAPTFLLHAMPSFHNRRVMLAAVPPHATSYCFCCDFVFTSFLRLPPPSSLGNLYESYDVEKLESGIRNDGFSFLYTNEFLICWLSQKKR